MTTPTLIRRVRDLMVAQGFTIRKIDRFLAQTYAATPAVTRALCREYLDNLAQGQIPAQPPSPLPLPRTSTRPHTKPLPRTRSPLLEALTTPVSNPEPGKGCETYEDCRNCGIFLECIWEPLEA